MMVKEVSLLTNHRERQYIINLQKNRSLFALLASAVSLFFAIYAITSGLILYAKNGARPIDLFQYFTIDANAVTAFASSMIIPYAIDGLRKKRFYCPKWVLLFYYSGVVISRIDVVNAYGGYNFYLHLVCPIMILVSFFLIESYYKLTIKDAALTIIPIFIYAMVYIYEVVIIGEDNGGWQDIYYFTKYVSFIVSFIAMMFISMLVALMLKALYNKFNEIRKQKFIEALWDENVSPIEIKIEFFGLGRFFGKKEYKSYVTLPLDIISIVSDKYHIKIEELIGAFVKGMLDSIKENQEKNHIF